MPSSYTTSLRLTLPATGELAGQWGNTVNTGITELLDAAVAGTTTISTWGGPGVAYTLSNNSGTADEARRMFIVATGTPGEAKNVICPAVSKFYVFRNDTTGGFALTLKTPSGTGISVPAGQYKFLYCDGTNVVETFNSAGALTLSGALTVNGTTTLASNPTLSAGTANGVTYLNGSKVLTSGSALTFDGTNLIATRGLKAASAGIAVSSFVDGLSVGGFESIGFLASPGNSLAVGGYRSSQWSGVDLYAAGAVVASATSSGLSLASTSDLTLNKGTANGVTYLNGSKVLTTGSALTFNGTTTLTLNSGSQGYLIGPSGEMLIGADSSGLYVGNGAGGVPAIPIFFGSTGTTFQRWTAGGSEQMRLTSTGLGIGTSSPDQRLTVYTATQNQGASVYNTTGTGGHGGAITFGIQAGLSLAQHGKIFSSLTNGGPGTVAADMVFQQAIGGSLTEFMRASSGNLGLGVTPSAWGTTKALEFSYGAFSANSSVGTDVSGNCYYNGTNWIYRVTGVALRYNQATAGHSWHVASGTAGNAISFTQAMTLDESGNLGVGVTSAGCRFNATQAASAALGAQIALHNNASTAVGNAVEIALLTDSGASPSGIRNGRIRVVNENAGNGAANMQFWTWSGTTDAERARITSGGNLLVGTTTDPGSNNSRLAVDHTGSDYGLTLNTATSAGPNLLQFRNSNSNGEARLLNNTGGPLTFYRNPTTEAARITSGGDFIPIVQTAAPTLTSNQQMVFTLTSNTNLRISVRGTDGTTRVANITLA